MIIYDILLMGVAVLSGGIASIAGFGIGSLLTPLLALNTGISLAVAGVSIAHFLGTSFRFWKLKKYINKKVLVSFGVTSAIGGLVGALFHNIFQNVILTIVFGCLLVFAGGTGLTGISEKFRFSGPLAWVAGALSGLFGGLVGNQGGIRSAALFGFDLKGIEFVATATGIALAVDLVRMPVYLVTQGKQILNIWPLIGVVSIGVLIGTEAGVWMFRKIPEVLFKKIVSAIILFIGFFVLLHR